MEASVVGLSCRPVQCFLGKSDHPVCTSTRFPIVFGYSGRKESYNLSPGADSGLAGRVSHIICQPDVEHSWKNGEDPVEAVEDSKIPPPLNPSSCLHTKYRTRESTDPSPEGRESLKHSGKGPLIRRAIPSYKQAFRVRLPPGKLSLYTCPRLLGGPCGQETS